MPPPSSISGFVSKKTKQILVPYLLFSLIYCFGDKGYRDWALVFYASRNSLSMANSCTPLWFLPSFFVSVVSYRILLQYMMNSKERTLVCTVLGCLGIWCSLNDNCSFIGFPLSVNVALVGIFLMECGNLIHTIEERVHHAHFLFFVAGLTGCLTFMMNLPTSLTPGNPHVEMAIGSFGNPLLFLFNSVSLCGLLIVFSFFANKHTCRLYKIVEYYGQNTLSVLCLHPLALTLSLGAMHYIPSYLQNDILTSVMASIISMIVIPPVIKIMNIFVPNMLGKS